MKKDLNQMSKCTFLESKKLLEDAHICKNEIQLMVDYFIADNQNYRDLFLSSKWHKYF